MAKKEDLPVKMSVEFPADGRKPGLIELWYADTTVNRMEFSVSSPYGQMFKALRLGCHNVMERKDDTEVGNG